MNTPALAFSSSVANWLRAARARGGVVELAGLLPGQRQQLCGRIRGQVGAHRDDEGPLRHHRDRSEALDGVEGQARLYRGVRDEAGGHGGQRVAVGRRLGHDAGAQRAARAGLVVDQHRLAKRFRQAPSHCARENVVRAAGRIRHDHGDRARGPRLLRQRNGAEGRGAKKRCQCTCDAAPAHGGRAQEARQGARHGARAPHAVSSFQFANCIGTSADWPRSDSNPSRRACASTLSAPRTKGPSTICPSTM